MNLVMDHRTGVGSIAQPVKQQSIALPLYQGRPRFSEMDMGRLKYHSLTSISSLRITVETLFILLYYKNRTLVICSMLRYNAILTCIR